MELIRLQRDTLSEWAGFIPEELFVELMHGGRHLYAVGVTFKDKPAGALCWEENGKEWVLQSIFIHPEYRHLRLGSELVAYLSEEMKKKNCGQLSVSYEQEGEREILTPFLQRCGFMMETMAIPLGVTTLEKVIEVLKKMDAFRKKKGRIRTIDQLSKRERYLCNEWLLQEIGESISSYVQERPASYVILKEDELTGILLFSEQQQGISLDYCWVRQDCMVNFFPLLAVAANDFFGHYPRDTRIEMILSTEQVQSLYSRLLGEEREQIILCKGHFLPVQKELLVSF